MRTGNIDFDDVDHWQPMTVIIGEIVLNLYFRGLLKKFSSQTFYTMKAFLLRGSYAPAIRLSEGLLLLLPDIFCPASLSRTIFSSPRFNSSALRRSSLELFGMILERNIVRGSDKKPPELLQYKIFKNIVVYG